ncbi:MAG: hypothetical protein H2050_15655 [Sphingobium sp.]|uniref:hypothetical protein n=1 Tax=Sphingobium sp. TaxID=1912891 RepID=UPI00179BDC1F|nr:hypothetical protein [Sphingobium sp.]MBA4756261.1 hypothetical protein [Sphingobium sp.]
MPAPESEPPVIGMHPAVFALIIAVSAGLWVGCFKLMAAACRAMSPIVGGQ